MLIDLFIFNSSRMSYATFIFHLCFLFNINIRVVNGDVGWFWQISDFHYDFSYYDEQVSCRGPNVTDDEKFGSRYCDPPWSLVEASVDAMKRLKSDVDFILWTGDTVTHGKVEDLSLSINDELIGNTTTLIRNTFPGMQVFPCLGNNDQWPDDQFRSGNEDIYNLTLARWRHWIDADQEENYLKGGYYTMLTASGIRMVMMNTNIYYKSNDALNLTSDVDPTGQLDWLGSVLASAVTNGEKVIISAHIAPGLDSHADHRQRMYDQFNDRIINILIQYSDVISSMHFGHDHADAFRVLLNSAGTPVIPLFLAPSVTPWQWYLGEGRYGPGHNPGIRLVKYDRKTGEALDIVQYYLDYDKVNAQKMAMITDWYLAYNITTDYQLTDLSPDSLFGLATRIRSSKTEWYNYMYFKWNLNAQPANIDRDCNEDCRRSFICGLTNFNTRDLQNCKHSFDIPSSANKPASVLVAVLLTYIMHLGKP